jgi:DNA polymerase
MSDPRGPREQQLGDWLQYFQDIGIREFYRDRLATEASASAALRVQSEITGARAEAARAQLMAGKPGVTIGRHSAAKNSPSAPAATPFIPVERGASLFEASDKIADDSLGKIRGDIGDCTRCKLCEKRTNIVFGVGNPKAELVFVGEGPGRDEDMQGEPFVGRAGQLLTQMIEAMGLQRSDVYICNVVKCRPPENRLPEKDEIEICSPFLLRQLDTVKPKIIVALGSCAVQMLLQTKQGITGLRGKFFPFRGTKLMATYHPAYLLRNPPAKPDVWKDLQLVMSELGLPEPKKKTVKK